MPERIASGEYTWQDMLDTAAEAVEAGVVEPGYGWWHRPANGPDFLYYYYSFGGEVIDPDGSDKGLSRCPDGSDSDQNNTDFRFAGITPGAENDCGGACGDPATLIHEVQGSSPTSPLNGT